VVSIAAYLTAERVMLDHCNHRTWDGLTGQVDPGTGRRAVFHNAGVLLEMIDYACQVERSIDSALADALRVEAMGVRLSLWAPPPWA
jgi:hypothetical protein